MGSAELLRRWPTDEALVAELRAVAGEAHIREVNVAISDESRMRGASMSLLGERVEHHAFETAAVCLGCLVKPFIATLVTQASLDGCIDLDAGVEAQLPEVPARTRGVLADITVRQLLNHTHGLDASALMDAPRTAAGAIDLDALLERVQGAGRLAASGELYSYDNFGAWLAASLLESRLQAPVRQLLIERLFDPLQIELRSAASCVTHSGARHDCCPALGGRMAVRMSDLLRFLEFSFQRTELLNDPVALPGWASERGACLGWKSYGDGWYGHNSDTENCSGVIRFSPRRRLAIVTTALNRSASLIEGRLFGRMFPSIHPVLPWRQSRLTPATGGDPARYAGTYANNACRLIVDPQPDGALALKSENEVESATGVLKPVCEHTFLSGLPRRTHLSWLQFVRPSAEGSFGYLWNGREVFRRQGVAGAAPIAACKPGPP